MSNDPSIEEEGYVIEDSAGFMTKLKLPFYQYWKFIRGIKHRLGAAAARSPQHEALFHSEHVKFLAWAKQKTASILKISLLSPSETTFTTKPEAKKTEQTVFEM